MELWYLLPLDSSNTYSRFPKVESFTSTYGGFDRKAVGIGC